MLALVPVAGAGDSAKVAASAVNWFPSLLACLAGFRQKFAYELMDNIMKTVGTPAGVHGQIQRLEARLPAQPNGLCRQSFVWS